MTRTWTDEDVKAAVRESTERSGVPYHVTDEATLRRIASLSAVELEDVA